MTEIGVREQSRLKSAFQLPPDIADFTGRAAEIKQILQHYQERTRVIEFSSGESELNHTVVELCAADEQRGLGVSALGIHLAHRLKHKLSDACLYLDLSYGSNQQALRPRDVLWYWLAILREAEYIPNIPGGWYERSCEFQADLKQSNVVVVLDNVSDETQIESFLTQEHPSNYDWCHQCLILVISQRPLAIEKSASWTIGPLEVADAVELLATLAGASRIQGREAIAQDLVKRCGYLPSPIRIAGRFLKRNPEVSVAEYCQSLEAEQARLKAMNDPQRELGAVVSLSHKAMSQTDAQHFLMMGVMPSDFALETMQAVLRLEAEKEERTCAAMADRWIEMQLLKPSGQGRYEYQTLARDFANNQLTAEATEAIRTTLINHCCETAEGFANILELERRGKLSSQPGPNADEQRLAATTWFLLERSHLMTCINWAFTQQKDTAVVKMTGYLSLLCSYRETWLNPAILMLPLATEAAKRSNESFALAAINGLLAAGCSRQKQWESATLYYEQSLLLLRERDEPYGNYATELVLPNLAIAYRKCNRWPDAIRICETLIAQHQSSENQRGVAVALSDLGSIFAAWGRWSDAVAWAEDSIANGKTGPAIQAYQKGIVQQFFPSSFGPREGEILNTNHEDLFAFKLNLLHYFKGAVNLGYEAKGNAKQPGKKITIWEQALQSYEASRAIWHQLGDREEEAQVLADMGDCWHSRHNHRKAERYWKKALRKLPRNSDKAEIIQSRLPDDIDHLILGVGQVQRGMRIVGVFMMAKALLTLVRQALVSELKRRLSSRKN